MEHWQLRTLVVFAALCTAHGAVRAQQLEELPQPEPRVEQAPDVPQPADEAPVAAQDVDEEASVETPAAALEAAAPLVSSNGVGNAEIQELVTAGFSDSTILAVIRANDVEFDVSPRALVALKNAGVSEPVIEAMLAAEAGADAVAPEPTPAQAAETQASVEYEKLTAMIEQLAARQDAAEKARRAPAPPESRSDPAPRVWLVDAEGRAPIAPTIAQVAFAGGSGRRGERMKNLQGLAGQALTFANPAIGGIASTLGNLFRPDEERTGVWALAGTQSARVLDVPPVFEIDYAHIPGVDPERYQPAIVQLVPTNDNYRLVAAAETDGGKGAVPSGPIIEESVATQATRLARGQYRVAPKSELGPGEYALVLRPLPETRGRRRNSEASLGELLGGSTSQILYLTWEFSIAADAAVANAL
jgi:hypothetical protein